DIETGVRSEHKLGRWAVGPSDVTLFLFFAGIGTTLVDANGSEKRCLLFYDPKPTPLHNNCLSTTDIEELLNSGKWKDVILVLDASYDGTAASRQFSLLRSINSSLTEQRSSRTLSDYFASDKAWRDTSGVQQDRIFLVCGGTNNACRESTLYKHGI